jgi:hypothetical protein
MRTLSVSEAKMVSGGDTLPAGFSPVGDGTKYMQDGSGTYYLTPTYAQNVSDAQNAGWGIDWRGVALDLVMIGGGGAAKAGGIFGAVSGVLAAGASALKQEIERIKREQAEEMETIDP